MSLLNLDGERHDNRTIGIYVCGGRGRGAPRKYDMTGHWSIRAVFSCQRTSEFWKCICEVPLEVVLYYSQYHQIIAKSDLIK